jgi:curved DNA-binding protein CbpA
MQSSPPLTGTLQAKPLYRLLIGLLERRVSGSLVLETPEGKKSALLLQDGKVVKIKPADRVSALGSVCIQLGYFKEPALQEVLAAPRSGLLGEALVAAGVLTADHLSAALEHQLLSHVSWLAALAPSTVFGIYEGQDFLARWGGPPRSVDPLTAIWRAVRAVEVEASGLPGILELLEDHPLRLHAEARVGRFGFDPKERSVVDVVRAKPQTLTELLALGLVPPAVVQRVIGVLALTQHLDVGGERGPLDVAWTPQVAPAMRPRDLLLKVRSFTPPANPAAVVGPADATAELRARRAEIEASSERLGAASYYELLNVPADAPAGVIQSAFLQQAKRWHPDKLETDLSDLKVQVNKVFSRLTQAHQVLTDAQRRAEYDKALANEGSSDAEQAEVHRALSAAAAFQKAQILVRRAEWDEALVLAQEAQAGDSEQAEYVALVAWLEARKLAGAPPEAYLAVIDRLTRASRLQPNNLRVRMYRADVLKAAGRLNDALREFRHVAEVDPNNVEAQRELRLHKMRSGNATSSEHRLFGKLFKKP